MPRPTVIAICGSTRTASTNLAILRHIAALVTGTLDVQIFTGLATLPHFNPDDDGERPPQIIKNFRAKILGADAVLICTPEYVFSLPGALKNALEWCVSTTVFSGKPVACITAAAHGAKAHEALLMIMRTIEAKVVGDAHTLLIQGAKGKIDAQGTVADEHTRRALDTLVHSFTAAIREELLSAAHQTSAPVKD